MKHARILIIEDDADTADMLKIYFSSQGASVDVAPTGAKALAAVGEKLPDLILLDIMLPDMDGYTICQKLRSTSHSSHIPILFLTQKNSRADIISGLEIGADDYLTKPFDLEELRLRARNALRRSKTYRQIDARTSLPTGDLIRSTLSRLITRDGWAAFLIRIHGFEGYRKTGRLFERDEILGRTAALLETRLREVDNENPFVGYLSEGDFLVITQHENVGEVQEAFSSALPMQIDRKAEASHVVDLKTEEPGLVQLRLESTGQETELKLEVGKITYADGPFENEAYLLEALFDSIAERG